MKKNEKNRCKKPHAIIDGQQKGKHSNNRQIQNN